MKSDDNTDSKKPFRVTASLRNAALLGAVTAMLAFPLAMSLRTKTPVAPAAAAVSVHARFGQESASADVRHMADWVLHSQDNRQMAFVIVDKKDAKVYVFDARGRLKAATPALMGAAQGDDTVPGIGDKPLSQVKPEEKTTPAGRFVAELGMNTGGEDIVWVDYDAAVSMHRVRANVKSERRLERLASATPDDNRISFGCINLPPAFYEQVLRPAVQNGGAVIYVLPEVHSLPQTFAGYYELSDGGVRLAHYQP